VKGLTQPSPKERALKKNIMCIEVLSFGEDLGEAKPTTQNFLNRYFNICI
jgi:hypothetical protein